MKLPITLCFCPQDGGLSIGLSPNTAEVKPTFAEASMIEVLQTAVEQGIKKVELNIDHTWYHFVAEGEQR